MAETKTPVENASTQPVEGPPASHITPEEMVLLKHRLATIDNAIPLDEFMARVDQAVAAKGVVLSPDKS